MSACQGHPAVRQEIKGCSQAACLSNTHGRSRRLRGPVAQAPLRGFICARDLSARCDLASRLRLASLDGLASNMRPLPFSLLLALALAHLRAPHCLPASKWQSDRAPTSRGNERAVQHMKHVLLSALNLQQIPRVHTELAKQLRSMWRERLPVTSHVSAITAGSPPAGNGTQSQTKENVTGTNVSTTPSPPRQCCQMESQISLTDLGWQDWILYPEQITYVHCASCRRPRNALARHCHHNQMSTSSRSHRKGCCRPVKTVWVPIVYLDEDLSLVISNIPLAEECGEQN